MTSSWSSDGERATRRSARLRRARVQITQSLAGSKVPAQKDWTNTASADPDVVRTLFHPGDNIGICCGPQPNGINLVAIDVDPKNGGVETMEALLKEHGDFTPTATHLTPSQGYHFFFHTPEPLSSSAGLLGRGIDVQGIDRQVLVPPSRLVDEHGVITLYSSPPGKSLLEIAVSPIDPWLWALLTKPVAIRLDQLATPTLRHVNGSDPFDRLSAAAGTGWGEVISDGWSGGSHRRATTSM